MPQTMQWWKEPMLDLLVNTEAVPGKDKTPAQADQQGTSISKPGVRLDYSFNDFDKAPGTPHDGSFIGEISNSKVTDGMKKAGY